MQQLLDRLLLAVFLPFWGLCFVLSVQTAYQERGYPPVAVSLPPDPDAYPVVTGLHARADRERSELRVGDRLLRLGGADLRGVGPVGLATRAAQERGPRRRLGVRYERAGVVRDSEVELESYALYWPRFPASVVFVVTALALTLRARPSAMVRATVHTYLSVALLLVCTFAGAAWETHLSIGVHILSLSLAAALSARSVLLFPHNVLPSAAWARAVPWAFAILGPFDASRFYDAPFSRSVGLVGTPAVGLLEGVVLLAVMTRTYRRSDAIARRQLRWVLYGAYCAFAPPLLLAILAAVDPRFTRLLVASFCTVAIAPMAVLISIVRYNLFDIDRLISTTASSSILGIMLLALLMAAVPRLARALSTPSGLDPSTAQLVLSLVLAAMVIPAHRRLRPRIDQAFFADRYAWERGFEQLLDELSRCTRPDELIRLAGTRLHALLRPESCVIYARSGAAFTPVCAQGSAIPPAFDARSPLVAALEARATPLTAERFADHRGAAALSPFDRAALETLGVPLVVPMRRSGTLVAFLCLGPKRSGDVYTPTDVAMLAAMGDKVSGELLRFDQVEMLRQAQSMQASFRRYVPDAVAEQLASGAEIDLGECDLTVLFVDLRGYSSLAEQRPAGDIFSTVNRYTQAVSDVIRSHGGTVVEFGGDGMMAVFGAPRPLPEKERVAVEAACAIVKTVRALPLEELPGQAPLAVGVGLATGPAFVGNVHAVDRLIWTAIGRTVNLAARLQALTRELGASAVIDARTWALAGPAAGPFRKHADVAIRGHTQPEDVYALPLEA